MPDIHARIRAGEFTAPVPRPFMPESHGAPSGPDGGLSPEQRIALPKIRAAYLASDEHLASLVDDYDREREDAARRFRLALEAEHGIVGHPAAASVWAMACANRLPTRQSDIAEAYAGIVAELRRPPAPAAAPAFTSSR